MNLHTHRSDLLFEAFEEGPEWGQLGDEHDLGRVEDCPEQTDDVGVVHGLHDVELFLQRDPIFMALLF